MSNCDALPAQAWFVDGLATPAGPLRLVVDDTGALRALVWEDAEAMQAKLRARASSQGIAIRPGRAPASVRDALDAYFAGEVTRIDGLRIATGGTPFQRAVWGALRAIAPGSTATYREVATAVGAPRAARAVGIANRDNPIGIVVPCHRVIGASGALTGYAGGLGRKRWLIAHEAAACRRVLCAAESRS
jgi:methylated-DNA-[protein]-cysteine S-methyltransferase